MWLNALLIVLGLALVSLVGGLFVERSRLDQRNATVWKRLRSPLTTNSEGKRGHDEFARVWSPKRSLFRPSDGAKMSPSNRQIAYRSTPSVGVFPTLQDGKSSFRCGGEPGRQLLEGDISFGPF